MRERDVQPVWQPIVLAVVRDSEWMSHIRAALDAFSSLTFVDEVHQLPAAAEITSPDAAIWHLDRLVNAVDSYAVALQRLRRIAPHCVVIAYGQVDRSIAPLLLIAGRVGVDRLLIRGFNDLEVGVRDVLKTTSLDCVIRETLMRLDVAPGPTAMAVARCLRRTLEGSLTVQQLADDLKVNRKTVSVWFRDAALPPPQRFIGWCRLYWVARLLDDERLSIAHAARTLRFSSEPDLRRMVARYAGCTPTQLRNGGGATRMLAALRGCRVAEPIRADRAGAGGSALAQLRTREAHGLECGVRDSNQGRDCLTR